MTAKRIIFILFATGLCIHIPVSSRPFELTRSLQVGAHVGYSGTYIDPVNFPNVFNGAAFGVQVVLGLTEWLALSWESAFDWHPDYQNYLKEEVEDEDGKVSMEWVANAMVEHYYVSTTALSIVYALDVTRVLPYFSAGPAGVRVDKTTAGLHAATHGFGMRVGGGFDYSFKQFTLGAGITSDRFFVGNTDHDRRILFFVRVSSLFRI